MTSSTVAPELENPNPTAPPLIESAAAPASGTDDVASVNPIEKKMKRAERFGVPVHLSELEKRNSRAQRFGTPPAAAGPEASKSAEELKKKARAERFGILQPASTNEDSKKKARLERFGAVAKMDPLEEEKKKARAIRFSQAQLTLKSQENAEGPIASKTVGEAGVA